jgi:hypothetical protein
MNLQNLLETHQFNISDAEAHKQWEELCKFKISSDTVRVTREFYLNNAEQIQRIQLLAASRLKRD